MENTTMTIDATHTSRVRSVCPEVGQILLAGNRDRAQGTTVPATVLARVTNDALAPTFVVDGFGAPKDLAFPPFGEPPV